MTELLNVSLMNFVCFRYCDSGEGYDLRKFQNSLKVVNIHSGLLHN
jgi:hypothetical protein